MITSFGQLKLEKDDNRDFPHREDFRVGYRNIPMIHEINPEIPFHKETHIIYTLCLAFVIIAAILLPLIDIDISVHAPASIRPTTEIIIIRSVASGRLSEYNLSENRRVEKGDLLYTLESESLDEELRFMEEKFKSSKSYAGDLIHLISSVIENKLPDSRQLKNPFYRQSLNLYNQLWNEAQIRDDKAKTDFTRQKILFKEKVIAAAEFENYLFELQKAEDGLQQVKEKQLNEWQEQLKNLYDEIERLSSQSEKLRKEKSNLCLRAPLDGTLQNVTALNAGSAVFANQEFGQISPDTNLVVIAYVKPEDIGLIESNMNVRMQVDAYNYNLWGMVTGRVVSLPSDIKMIENKPAFEVRCSLDRDFLQLKNGFKGVLKKGMTVQAHFQVTRRSLWQFLYDHVDDWINPGNFEGK